MNAKVVFRKCFEQVLLNVAFLPVTAERDNIDQDSRDILLGHT